MTWRARLSLDYLRVEERTVCRFVHEGPLRVLQSLYPDGPGVCHNVLVHPPSGLVGGDELVINAQLGAEAQALITSPGATRFYASAHLPAAQRAHLTLAPGARLEWLPLETIAYSGCRAENAVSFELAERAQVIGWDMTALGLAASGAPFLEGHCTQSIELKGVWLERGRLEAGDRLLDSPLGLGGLRALGTMYFLSGTALGGAQLQHLVDQTRAQLPPACAQLRAQLTTPSQQVLVLRALATSTEALFGLFKQVLLLWRRGGFAEVASARRPIPRIWST